MLFCIKGLGRCDKQREHMIPDCILDFQEGKEATLVAPRAHLPAVCVLSDVTGIRPHSLVAFMCPGYKRVACSPR